VKTVQFSARGGIVAMTAADAQSKAQELDKCLEIALANRAFEIDLVWKRTLVFWGFVAVLFIGIVQAIDKSRALTVALVSLGGVFSLVWTLVSRGSKSWQESWEIKSANFLQERYNRTGLFRRASGPRAGVIWTMRSQPYSPSRLLIALSDFALLFWVGLLGYMLHLETVFPLIANLKARGVSLVVGFSVLYGVYVLIFCRSREGDASGALREK